MSSLSGASSSNDNKGAVSVEQLIGESFAKLAHIILSSRIHEDHSHIQSGQKHPTNSWFKLEIPEVSSATPSLQRWRTEQGISQPLIIEIYQHQSSNTNTTLLERWHIDYTPLPLSPSSVGNLSRSQMSKFSTQAVYKRLMLLVRSVYSLLRFLPAYKLYRTNLSSRHNRACSLSYRILSSPTAPCGHENNEPKMKMFHFTGVDTADAQLNVRTFFVENKNVNSSGGGGDVNSMRNRLGNRNTTSVVVIQQQQQQQLQQASQSPRATVTASSPLRYPPAYHPHRYPSPSTTTNNNNNNNNNREAVMVGSSNRSPSILNTTTTNNNNTMDSSVSDIDDGDGVVIPQNYNNRIMETPPRRSWSSSFRLSPARWQPSSSPSSAPVLYHNNSNNSFDGVYNSIDTSHSSREEQVNALIDNNDNNNKNTTTTNTTATTTMINVPKSDPVSIPRPHHAMHAMHHHHNHRRHRNCDLPPRMPSSGALNTVSHDKTFFSSSQPSTSAPAASPQWHIDSSTTTTSTTMDKTDSDGQNHATSSTNNNTDTTNTSHCRPLSTLSQAVHNLQSPFSYPPTPATEDHSLIPTTTTNSSHEPPSHINSSHYHHTTTTNTTTTINNNNNDNNNNPSLLLHSSSSIATTPVSHFPASCSPDLPFAFTPKATQQQQHRHNYHRFESCDGSSPSLSSSSSSTAMLSSRSHSDTRMMIQSSPLYTNNNNNNNGSNSNNSSNNNSPHVIVAKEIPASIALMRRASWGTTLQPPPPPQQHYYNNTNTNTMNPSSTIGYSLSPLQGLMSVGSSSSLLASSSAKRMGILIDGSCLDDTSKQQQSQSPHLLTYPPTTTSNNTTATIIASNEYIPFAFADNDINYDDDNDDVFLSSSDNNNDNHHNDNNNEDNTTQSTTATDHSSSAMALGAFVSLMKSAKPFVHMETMMLNTGLMHVDTVCSRLSHRIHGDGSNGSGGCESS